jgi:dephospho-CoA kinase
MRGLALPSKKAVIGIVGMPGAGKSVASETAENLGCEMVIMGDVIREEIRSRGLEPTPEIVGKTMLEIRAKEGLNAVAKRCVSKIMSFHSRCIIIDGIRSLDEVTEFKKSFPSFILIAIQASPQIRFERLYKRKRSDAPSNWAVFLERDQRELRVGVEKAIKIANYTITNEGSLQEFKENVASLLKKVVSLE